MAVKVEDPNKPKQGAGLPGFLQGIGGMLGDWGNSIGDTWNNASKWLTVDAPGAVAAWVLGAEPPSTGTSRRSSGGPFGYSSPDPNSRSNGPRGWDKTPHLETPDERLRRILGYSEQYGLGGSVDYSPVMDALTNQANQNEARIAAMYSQLQNQIGADATPLGQIYDTAASSYNQNADSSSSNLQTAAQTAMDAQTDQLSKLGIGAALPAVNAGGSVTSDLTHALGNIEQGRATNLNENTSKKASALTANAGRKDLAGLEGNEYRTKILNDLATQLAGLQVKQAEANRDSGANKLQWGMTIDQILNGNPQDEADQKAAADKQAQELAEFLFKQNSASGKAAQSIWQLVYQQTGGNQQAADEAVARLQGQGYGF